jgi:3-hydroxybutyryl-CoA dehydrogenase
MTREITTVGVVGLGTMGAGIAEVVARSGLDVVAVEADPARVEAGRSHVEQSTSRALARGKLSEAERQGLLARIRFTAALDDVAPAQLVVEAVPEKLDLKREIFGKLDSICPPDVVLATNTSSLSVTEISVATHNPGRVVGLHFFNPAPVQKLVEVVRTVVTEPDVVESAVRLAHGLGKQPVVVGDRAGFIANALLFGYLNHAVRMYEEHHATREDLDAAMTLGCGLPLGPLALLDLVGLDVAHDILQTMYTQSRDRRHAPAPLLTQLVAAGLLGRKTGRGFYTYAAPGSGKVVPDAVEPAPPFRELGDAGTRDVRTVGVVGSGTTATGIAELFAGAGYDVLLVRRPEKADADPNGALDGIRRGGKLADLADADLVVESSAGEPGVKRALFENLDEICKPGAVLATTASWLPVVECAAATSRAGDVVGLHLLSSGPHARVVEVVHSVVSAPDAVATALAVCERLGAHAVRCADRAGFIADALLFPYLNDAVRMLAEHYATADDIDTAMTAGCGYPTGPFELLDGVGLDAALTIQRALYSESREPGHAPVPLLVQLVIAGYLGRATGQGFRTYD